VLVTIEYRVDPARRAESSPRWRRARNAAAHGAFFWELFHDRRTDAISRDLHGESWSSTAPARGASVADREIQRRANSSW